MKHDRHDIVRSPIFNDSDLVIPGHAVSILVQNGGTGKARGKPGQSRQAVAFADVEIRSHKICSDRGKRAGIQIFYHHSEILRGHIIVKTAGIHRHQTALHVHGSKARFLADGINRIQADIVDQRIDAVVVGIVDHGLQEE